MYQTHSLIISSLRLPLAAGHISWLSFRSVASRQYNIQLLLSCDSKPWRCHFLQLEFSYFYTISIFLWLKPRTCSFSQLDFSDHYARIIFMWPKPRSCHFLQLDVSYQYTMIFMCDWNHEVVTFYDLIFLINILGVSHVTGTKKSIFKKYFHVTETKKLSLFTTLFFWSMYMKNFHVTEIFLIL